ncbi:MAG: Gfo/Idh/MocA family oxidoreductase [Anaerolineae bacterium]|nr:Gfo/Idh/MocA family oxidoreductase [Anaerolineae bacterium]
MNEIGFGVIGVGTWGEMHARVYSAFPGVRLVAVSDLDEARGREVADRDGAAYYRDYRELLDREDIHAVSVVTPDHTHTGIATDAFEAGKHVLLEKPMAQSVAECERIIAASKRAGKKLMVDFHNRWNPPFYKAKRAIEQGEIGTPQLVSYRLNDQMWVPTDMLSWAARSSVLWFIGSHCIDTIMWMLDDVPEKVYSVARSRVLKEKGVDTPDFYQTTLEFRGGAVAAVENCWIVPNNTPSIIDLKCEIVGDRGALYVDCSHHRVLQKYTPSEATYPDVLVSPEIHGQQMGFAVESIRHFARCIIEDKEPLVTGEDGLQVTRVIAAAVESARRGEPVSL